MLRSEAEALQPACPSVPLAQSSEALLCLEPLCLPLSFLLPARQGPLEPLPPLPRPLGPRVLLLEAGRVQSGAAVGLEGGGVNPACALLDTT